jgi:hypothetical protein
MKKKENNQIKAKQEEPILDLMPDMGSPVETVKTEEELFPTTTEAKKSEKLDLDQEARNKLPLSSKNIQWHPNAFIKGQKFNTMLSRLKRRVVKVFDLENEETLQEYNDVMNQSLNDNSNIANFKTVQLKFSEQTGTFKALAIYDIVEFKNPLD